jgi:GH25 family lysozyme M1 (1,4-beta-N-acetylmuramidase)
VEGIDVGPAQGTIDWAKVKSSGRAFAIIKATQGTYNKSASFAAQWAGALGAGLLRAPLHFFDPTDDGVAQAQSFLAAVGTLGPTDLPPVLDLECPTSSNQAMALANCEFLGSSGWVPSATLTQRVHDWLNYVSAQTGRVPIIGTYNAWLSSSGAGIDVATLAPTYPLWEFSPTSGSCFSLPPGYTAGAVFWMWRTNGTCPGVSGVVDLDRFLGSLAELKQLGSGMSDSGSSSDASATPDVAAESGGPMEGGGDAVDAEGEAGDGEVDAPSDDSATPSVGADAGSHSAGAHGGCGCVAAGSPQAPSWLAWLAWIGVGAVVTAARAGRPMQLDEHRR